MKHEFQEELINCDLCEAEFSILDSERRIPEFCPFCGEELDPEKVEEDEDPDLLEEENC